MDLGEWIFTLFLLILFVLLVIIIVRLYQYNDVKPSDFIPKSLIDKNIDISKSKISSRFISEDDKSINTGDILGVSYRGMVSLFMNVFTLSSWTHVGIAMRDKNDELWILEAANYGKNYDGFFFIPFSDWLRINKHNGLCHLKYRGSPLSISMFENFQYKYKNIVLDSLGFHWLRFLKKKHQTKETNVFTCHELIILFLQEVDVCTRNITYDSYLPCDIVHRRLDFKTSAYDEMVILRYQNKGNSKDDGDDGNSDDSNGDDEWDQNLRRKLINKNNFL